MNTIRDARKAAGLTRREAAKALKITTGSYRYREENPYLLTIGQIEVLAKVFGISFERMWDLSRYRIFDNAGGGFNA